MVVELGKSSAFIKAAVLCHPSFVTVDDFKGMDFRVKDSQATCFSQLVFCMLHFAF